MWSAHGDRSPRRRPPVRADDVHIGYTREMSDSDARVLPVAHEPWYCAETRIPPLNQLAAAAGAYGGTAAWDFDPLGLKQGQDSQVSTGGRPRLPPKLLAGCPPPLPAASLTALPSCRGRGNRPRSWRCRRAAARTSAARAPTPSKTSSTASYRRRLVRRPPFPRSPVSFQSPLPSSDPAPPTPRPVPSHAGTILGLLVLSRVGVYIPLEGVDRAAFAEKIAGSGLLGYIDTLAGGSISKVPTRPPGI